MDRWKCAVCGYVYNPNLGDPEAGIGPGITFDELPDSWGCPDCGSEKEFFEQCEDDGSLPEDTYNETELK